MTTTSRLVWTLLNCSEHPELNSKIDIGRTCTRIIHTLFPGIAWRSEEEYYLIINKLVLPSLAKNFHWLVERNPKRVKSYVVNIYPVKTIQGREWIHTIHNKIAA